MTCGYDGKHWAGDKPKNIEEYLEHNQVSPFFCELTEELFINLCVRILKLEQSSTGKA